jgi:dihydroorotate dehydrogenase
MYRILRFFLFLLPPEFAHSVALKSLLWLHKLKITTWLFPKIPAQTQSIMGLTFKNSMGIAAGLDKNGDYIDCLASLGVGFIEVGAVTPRPQPGNLKPRLFRLPKVQALINRMGFNNKGVDYLVNNLRKRRTDCIVGINLGKNKDTPIAQAVDDYLICLEKVFPYADFVTINISSPNTADLRQLQTPEYLENLLCTLRDKNIALSQKYQKSLPLLVKIAPDLTQVEVILIAQITERCGFAGIIATNTMLARPETIKDYPQSEESGGLSGDPLNAQSREILGWLTAGGYKLNIISVGGISTQEEAQQRLAMGANLLQIYTAIIYKGPYWLYNLIKHLQ